MPRKIALQTESPFVSVLIDGEKKKLCACLNRVKPLKSPPPEFLFFFSLNWIFESDHPFIVKPMVINCSRCTKHPAIRPGFQTVSWQHAAHALKVIS